MDDILSKARTIIPTLDAIEFDGKIHKVKLAPNDAKKSSWYCAFQNYSSESGEPFYVIRCENYWTAEKETFTAGDTKMSAVDRQNIKRQIAEARRKGENERREKAEKAKRVANDFWNSLESDSATCDYLTQKGYTEAFGSRAKKKVLEGRHGYVPLRDCNGVLWNLQKLQRDGGKYFEEDATVEGCFHQIGELSETQAIRITEGFATGCAVHLATDREAVFVAFQSGNLVSVAKELKRKYSDRVFIVCGDDDRFKTDGKGNVPNAGKKKAEEAAALVSGIAVFPTFPPESKGTDFDDLLRECGLEAVKSQLQSQLPVALDDGEIDEHFIQNFPYPDENEMTFARKATMANVDELLRRLKIKARYNIISKEEEMIIPGQVYSRDNHLNAKLAYVLDWCERVKIPTSHLSAYVTAISDRNPYNPVATWIESKPWDGVSRFQEFCDTIKAKNEDTDTIVYALKNTLMRRWMIGAVAAAYEPEGITMRGVLTLQGLQNSGKTHWFKKLAPKSLRVLKDGVTLNPQDKDSVFKVISSWIVELGELDTTFRKADLGALKAFTTNDADVIRRPYAVKESTYARRTVFFASVNQRDFLKDPTGNSRFWTIATESVDHHHAIDMQQVWAEVFTFYQDGESWHLTLDELDALNSSNENFTELHPAEERIMDYFDWHNKVNTNKYWLSSSAVCREIGIQNPSQADTRAAARVLKKLCGDPKKNDGSLTYLVPFRLGRKPMEN